MKTTKTMKTGGAKPKAMYGKEIMQKGGSKKTKDSIEDKAVKRYPNYLGKDTAYDNAKKNVKSAVKGAKTVAKTVIKSSPEYKAAKGTDDFLEKRYPNYFGKGTMYSKVKKGIKSVFQNGGTVKPVVTKSVVKKPVPKKVVPASSSDMKTFRLMQGYDTKGNKVEKMQKGGFPITEKAAARKVAKGKGMMTYKYGNTDAPGTGNNKGAYVKFAKDQESNPYGGKSLKGSRSRSVMQKGGISKKK